MEAAETETVRELRETVGRLRRALEGGKDGVSVSVSARRDVVEAAAVAAAAWGGATVALVVAGAEAEEEAEDDGLAKAVEAVRDLLRFRAASRVVTLERQEDAGVHGALEALLREMESGREFPPPSVERHRIDVETEVEWLEQVLDARVDVAVLSCSAASWRENPLSDTAHQLTDARLLAFARAAERWGVPCVGVLPPSSSSSSSSDASNVVALVTGDGRCSRVWVSASLAWAADEARRAAQRALVEAHLGTDAARPGEDWI